MKLSLLAMVAVLVLNFGAARAEGDDVGRWTPDLSVSSLFSTPQAASSPTKPITHRSRSVRTDGVHGLVTEAAQRHRIPVAIAHAIVKVESGYRCNASAGGAHGIMQVKPATARGVGVNGNLFDCRIGLEAGMRYLREAFNRYGSGCGGISAYNTGIHKTGYCTSYGRKVLAQN